MGNVTPRYFFLWEFVLHNTVTDECIYDTFGNHRHFKGIDEAKKYIADNLQGNKDWLWIPVNHSVELSEN